MRLHGDVIFTRRRIFDFDLNRCCRKSGLGITPSGGKIVHHLAFASRRIVEARDMRRLLIGDADQPCRLDRLFAAFRDDCDDRLAIVLHLPRQRIIRLVIGAIATPVGRDQKAQIVIRRQHHQHARGRKRLFRIDRYDATGRDRALHENSIDKAFGRIFQRIGRTTGDLQIAFEACLTTADSPV